MLGLVKYQDDFSKAPGFNQLCYKDTATTAVKADNDGFAAMHAYLIDSPTVKCTLSFRNAELIYKLQAHTDVAGAVWLVHIRQVQPMFTERTEFLNTTSSEVASHLRRSTAFVAGRCTREPLNFHQRRQ